MFAYIFFFSEVECILMFCFEGLSDTGTRHSVRTYADLYDGAAKNIINNFDDIIGQHNIYTQCERK